MLGTFLGDWKFKSKNAMRLGRARGRQGGNGANNR
jgi:hypothetical protein